MKKYLIGGAIGLAMTLAPLAAMAAVNVNNILFDGAANVTAGAGSNVSAQVYITNDSANDVESLFIKFPSSGGITEQGKCYDVSDEIGVSPVNGWTFDIDLLVPSNNGTWGPEVSTHGTNGSAADNNCSTTADDMTAFPGTVTVTGGSTIGNSSSNAQLIAMIAALQAQIQALQHPTAPASGAGCAALTAKLAGTVDNTYNQANKVLQGFLISEGFEADMPALTAGASFGYKGPQTRSAVSHFQSTHNCN